MTLRAALLVAVTCLILGAWACEPDEKLNGCKMIGASCRCGWGCRSDYEYSSRRACRNALKVAAPTPAVAAPPPPQARPAPLPPQARPAPAPAEQSSNACARRPCARGTCLQTSNDIGYACKCEGTGFYGQRCEKACPTAPIRGMVFPHECIVI